MQLAVAATAQDPRTTDNARRLDQPARLTYSVGQQWCYRNYDLPSGELNRTQIEKVTGVDDRHVRIQLTARVSGRDLGPADESWDPRTGIRNPDLRVGNSWTEPSLDGEEVVGTAAYKVVRAERLSTLIGKFESYVIEAQFTFRSDEYRQVIWYSPAIGNFLRLVYLDERGQPTEASEITCFSDSPSDGSEPRTRSNK